MTHSLPSPDSYRKGGDCLNLFSDLEVSNIHFIIDFKQLRCAQNTVVSIYVKSTQNIHEQLQQTTITKKSAIGIFLYFCSYMFK